VTYDFKAGTEGFVCSACLSNRLDHGYTPRYLERFLLILSRRHFLDKIRVC
jgi:hypothetical protein